MMKPNGDFLMSTEEECLTATPQNPGDAVDAMRRFMQIFAGQAPSLPGTSGVFNGYGKVYVDGGRGPHIELAAIECDSPYLLPIVVEQQHALVARTLVKLQEEGVNLLLANNNHDQLLTVDSNVWGSHENYLVESHPTQWTNAIMPFLITRIYAGSGGVQYPNGNFLAGVRPLCMRHTMGGGTTEQRAIHSTSRDEHLMGPECTRFRYHQIAADGHRSHFNMALLFGATALAVKVAIFDETLPQQLATWTSSPKSENAWLRLHRKLNVLAQPRRSLQVHPLVIQIQQIYLEAAKRYADRLAEPPAWIPRLINDWEETLNAMQRTDQAWLAARLDAFAKYGFYSAVLRDASHDWKTLRGQRELFCKLALLDHSYHAIGDPASVFRRIERAGLLNHRVADAIVPGAEPDPYVPETRTRARARARFLHEHQENESMIVDWPVVYDCDTRRCCDLSDPFAEAYGPWRTRSFPALRHRRISSQLESF